MALKPSRSSSIREQKASELQFSRNMYPRAASRLLVLEESFKDTTYIKPSQSSNVSHEAFLHRFQSLTVVIKLCSHSWTSALISELENFKNKKQISSKQMDDFAEMENEYNKDSSEAAKVQRNTDEILKTSVKLCQV
ncbi:hypothetical protein Bca101_074385 [Brassica carinata]